MGPRLAICAANPANSAHPGRFSSVPQHFGLEFFRFFVDFDAPRTIKIIEKPQENQSFSMVFILSAKLLPNQKNKALEHAGTFKMEARTASNDPQVTKMIPGSSNMGPIAPRWAFRVPQWLPKGARPALLATTSAPKSKFECP